MSDNILVWIAILLIFIGASYFFSWLEKLYLRRLANEARLRDNSPADPNGPSANTIDTFK